MPLRGRSILGIAIFGLLVGGCAEGMPVYRPANATSAIGPLPAAHYALPPEHPTGEVFLASSGLTQLPESDGRAPALFVRMVVNNSSDPSPWRLDVRQQFVFVGQKWESPYVGKQAQTVIEIPRGERRIVDLYYALPEKIEGDEELPRFEIAWNVLAGERFVSERVAFDRTILTPPSYAYGYGPGWHRYGWYDPYFWPYPYYGIHVGFGHYGGYRGFRGYGGHYGGGRAPYVRGVPSRR